MSAPFHFIYYYLINEKNIMSIGLPKHYIAGIILGAATLAAAFSLGTGNVPAGAQTACVAPPSGMVGWWPADGNGNDIQGANNALLQNGTTFAAGQVGQAFSFDGVNDYASIPYSTNWEFGANNFTIDFWLYKVSNLHGYIARDATTLFSPWIIGSNDKIYMTSNGSSWDIVSGASMGMIPVNTWTHIAVTRNGSTFTVYNNGNVVSTWVSSAAIAPNANPLSIGKVQNQTNFNGRIDELEIFNRALTQSEIQSIVNAGSAGKCKTTSSAPACGNNVVESGEQCDDGNTANGDGCSATCQLEACTPGPTNALTNTLSHPESVDIPGLAYGPNASGKNVIWIGSYLGTGAMPAGTIVEMDPVTGAIITTHPNLGVNNSGPGSLAYDSVSAGGPYLWVANYNDGAVYKIRISDYTLASSFPVSGFCGRPLGGIAFDGANLWLSCPEVSRVFKLATNGTVMAQYAGFVTAGLEYSGNRLFTIEPGVINVRDMNFAIVRSYPFPDATGCTNDCNGELSTIDPATGDAYWGKRALTNLRKLHLVDSCQAQDTTPPETVITASPGAVSSSNAAVFEFSSNEPGGSFECRLDGAAFSFCTSPKSFNGLSDGAHIFEVRAKDAAGNVDPSPALHTWTVDTVAPASVKTTSPASPNGENGWFTSDVSYQVTATDGVGSGVAQIFVCQDQTNTCDPQVVNAGVSGVVAMEGNNFVRHQAKDNAGNLETIQINLVKIDKTNPTIALNALPPFDGDGLVTLAWTSGDTGSGIATVEVYRNGTLIHTSSNPNGSFVDDRSASGNDGQSFSYVARARDNAGKVADSAAQYTTIDLSPPSVPAIVPLSAYTNALSVRTQWNRAVDAVAGVDFYNVYRNTEKIATVDEPDPNGTDTSVRRSYTDNAVADGNALVYRTSAMDLAAPSHESAQSDAAMTTIDISAPVTVLTTSPASPNGDNGWFKTAFGVTLACTDAVSGCNDTRYSINGGASVIYTGAFMVQTDGAYIISYSSTDNAGNVERENSQMVKLDATKPMIAANAIPSATNNAALELSGTATDATSGIESLTINNTSVSLGASGGYAYTATLHEGQNSFAIVARDMAGNTQLITQEIVLDTTAPDTLITATPPLVATAADATFEFSANEAGAVFECSLDNGAYAACVSPKTYSGLAAGSHTFTVRSMDQVGNRDASPASYSWQIVLDDGDGIAQDIDTDPANFSDSFDTRPIGGASYGKIMDRGGFTVSVGKTVTLDVRVDVTGAGSKAKVRSCNNQITTEYDSGESVEITCGADSTTLHALSGTIRWRKPPTGKGTRGNVSAPDTITIVGDPKVVAASGNVAPSLVEVVDDVDAVVASCDLKPADSLDVKPTDADGNLVLTNTGSAVIACAVDGASATLAPGAAIVDQCSGFGGNVAGTGCPVADKNTVMLHVVNIGGGATTKMPLGGAAVRVFDRNSAAFQAVAGSKNPDGSLYGVIYEADAGRVGSCITGSDGVCYAGERTMGDYLVVVKYSDSATGKTVYIGRPKSPSDFVNGLAEKDFQIIKVFKKGVFQEYRGGNKMVVTGSVLEVIIPESAVWEGTQSLYPFIFASDSDWQIDVCAKVPEGYRLVGVYDESGSLISSAQCLQTGIANETKVIAFEVEEIASPEPSFVGTLKITRKGKVTPIAVKVSDIRKASFNAKLQAALEKAQRAQKQNDRVVKMMKVGASLWSIVRDVFGLEGRDADIMIIGKKIARLNAIRVPEWGIIEGAYDAGALPWGFELNLDNEALRLAQ